MLPNCFILISIIIIIATLLLLNSLKKHHDHFASYYHYQPYKRFHYADLDDPYFDTHTHLPFWNTQLGNKKNMSYDLRGDYDIPYYWFPFNASSIVPIKNQSI